MEQIRQLPESAHRELREGEVYEPYVPASETPHEFTVKALFFGMIFGNSLGLTIGIIIGEGNGIAIGLSMGTGIGMAIGMLFGASKDAEAKKQGRVLKTNVK